MNQARLVKWLSRIGDGSEGLWKQVILVKYGLCSSLDVSTLNATKSASSEGLSFTEGVVFAQYHIQGGSRESNFILARHFGCSLFASHSVS